MEKKKSFPVTTAIRRKAKVNFHTAAMLQAIAVPF
jgi:hypothetical protein